ncbi:MAG: DNA repair protein RecO [Clostridiales bacterium]|nr:DNA repair protein RecO [Clostridiales bacterium]MCF8021437.1 DNA repair protein RecO [Clostridiales bacterium]
MKLYKADAVVISSREMREADRVLVLYSAQRGKIRAAAHGVNKPSSRKRGAVQPFCYSSFLLYRGRELDSISQCEAIETFPGLRNDLDKISYASYIAQLVDTVIVEGNTDRRIFSLLLVTLHLLSSTSMDLELLIRSFEIKLMKFSGFKPELNCCVICGESIKAKNINFSSSAGGIICDNCKNNAGQVDSYPRGAVEVLRILLEWEITKVDRIKISTSIKKCIKKIMRDYINYYTEKKLDSMYFLDKINFYRF